MTDEQKPVTPEIDYKAAFDTQKAELDDSSLKMADLQTQLNSVLAHNEKVLGEKKAEQAKRAAAEDDKARKAGDFEQLLRSSESKNKDLANELSKLNGDIAKESVSRAAMNLATSMADGDKAQVLADIITGRLKNTADGMKVTTKDGDLTVSSLEDLKAELMVNYKFLVRGSQATGGGATGSGGSAPASKTMIESEYLKLDAFAQRKFIVEDKGKVIGG